MGDVNIEEKHPHAVAVVLVRYPRPTIAMFVSANEILEALPDSSLRSQHDFNTEIDHLKEAFACPWLRKCVKNLHNVEWERSREDQNSVLEDGNKVSGYKVKFEIDAFIGKSENKDHDDQNSIEEVLISIKNWKFY